MEKQPHVTIIVLNYNGLRKLGNILKSCIKSILETNYDNFTVIFTDNGSTDNSVQFIQTEFPSERKLKILPLPRNYGYAGGNNRAAMHAKMINPETKYLAFVNNDVIVKPDWLRKLVNFMGRRRYIGALQPLILYPDGRIQAAGWIIGKCGSPFPLYNGVTLEELNEVLGTREYIFPFYVYGACFITPSKIFYETGGFDENFFLYCEELDYCWRLWKLGYASACLLNTHVYHYESLTIGKYSSIEGYYNTRNTIWTMVKNEEDLVRGLLHVLLFILINIHIKCLRLKLPLKYKLSVLRGMLSAFKELRRALYKRPLNRSLFNRYLILKDMYHDELLILPMRSLADRLIKRWLLKRR